MVPVHGQNPDRLAEWLKKYPESDANKDGVLTRDEARAHRQTLQTERREDRRRGAPPTHVDLKYGPHPRNVIDVWLPADGKPAGLYVFFHGGGFVGGDKRGFDPTPWLEAGFAAASGNYRLVDGKETLSPVPMQDAARAIQFLRTKAGEWDFDPAKVAVGGSSAGAVIAAWIGMHDDLRKPESADPLERQSSRVACILPINGPLNLDPAWIREHMGGPHHIHGSFAKMFAPEDDSYASEAVAQRVRESNPWDHASADDPPAFLIYSTRMTELPLPEDASAGELVHHPGFGKAMKERLDQLGVANEFAHGVDPRGSTIEVEFVRKHLGVPGEAP